MGVDVSTPAEKVHLRCPWNIKNLKQTKEFFEIFPPSYFNKFLSSKEVLRQKNSEWNDNQIYFLLVIENWSVRNILKYQIHSGKPNLTLKFPKFRGLRPQNDYQGLFLSCSGILHKKVVASPCIDLFLKFCGDNQPFWQRKAN